jgi:heme a synthase
MHFIELLFTVVGIALLGLGPLWWVLHHHTGTPARLKALTLIALFFTFDLVVFGAFTRLSDSGLGCPDWPGCYASASPLGAAQQINAAQAAMPSGPVTHQKAWIEMIHRYLATALGLQLVVLAFSSWWFWCRHRQTRLQNLSPWWATATLFWVCLQGAFGQLTVTMKLFPAVVTAHLLGGLILFALLAIQRALLIKKKPAVSRACFLLMLTATVLTVFQIALGGWVSANYAVLACTEFPLCQGQWWPPMSLAQGFSVWHPLGVDALGEPLSFSALTAIHMVHRLGALLLVLVLGLLAWLIRATGLRVWQRWVWLLCAMLVWQVFSGVSNVVLGWPLFAALAHTAGAAILLALLLTAVVVGRS